MKKGIKNTGKIFHRCNVCNIYFRFKNEPEQFLCHTHRDKLCKICNKSIPSERKTSPSVLTCSEECAAENYRILDRERARTKRDHTGNTVDEVGGIFFGNVKEPLMPAVGNHGYLGVITYNKEKDKIQCHLCGKFFRSLNGSGHLKIHNISNDEYKEKFSLDRTMVLVAESTREKHLQAILNRSDYEQLQQALKKKREDKSDEAQKQRRTSNTGKRRRIGAKNKTGTCPLQLVDKIQVLKEKLGHIPNGEDFKREYKGKYMATIVQTYGSFNKALEYMGITPRDRVENKYSPEDLLKFMREFYVRFDRTPSNTDFKRGYLPNVTTYLRYFKTLNHARAQANIPLVLRFGGGWAGWKQIELTDELRKQFA